MTTPSFRLLSYPQDAKAIEAAFAELDTTLGGASVYQTHAWFRHNVDGPPIPGWEDNRVLILENERGICGVIPLGQIAITAAGVPVRVLATPSRSEVWTVQLAHGIAFAEALPGIRAFLGREWPGWDALVWTKQLPLSSARLPGGSSLARLTVSAPTGESMTLPVTEDPAEATARLSANARDALRKARNRLKGHQVEYRELDAPGVAMDEALEAFLMLEGAGWKQLDHSRWPVFRTLMAEMAPQGRFRQYQMFIDGTLAAGALALTGPPGRLGIYKIAYDESLARLSPGRLLVAHILEDVARRGGIRTVDLMSSAPWHARWNPVAEPLRTLWCFRPTPRGLLGFLAMTVWVLARPWVRQYHQNATVRGPRGTQTAGEARAS